MVATCKYKPSRDIYLTAALRHLEAAFQINDEYEHTEKLEILINQLKHFFTKRTRYDSSIIIMSFVIYSHSAAAYELLRRFVFLPYKRHLQSISSTFNITPNFKNEHNDERYLEHAIKSLSNVEKEVALLTDEIYIEPCLQFKSNNITGLSENNSNKLARTVQSYMIKSVYSTFKDIVRLVPVHNVTGKYLHELTDEYF